MPTTIFQEISQISCNNPVTPVGSVFVEGLFSVDLIDRDREIVDPTEFKLKLFANTATLLRNHEFIVDNNGNKYAAGKVHKTVPVIVDQENPNDSSEWSLKTIDSGEFVAFWPKDKSPDLLRGDRGAYAIAEVTHPEVVKQVVRGELGAFSWSGFTQEKSFHNNGVVELKNIDLIEISLVNTPANPNSTFVVTDEDNPALDLEVSLKDCAVYGMRFDKNTFNSDQVQKIKKSLSMNTSTISETEKEFSIQMQGQDLTSNDKVFSFRMGNFDVLAAPKNMNKRRLSLEKIKNINLTENLMDPNPSEQAVDVKEDKVETVKLYLLDIDGFKKRNPGAVITTQKTIEVEGTTLEIDTIQVPDAVLPEDIEVEVPVAQAATETEVPAVVVTEEPVEDTQNTILESGDALEATTVLDDALTPAVTEKLNQITAAMAQIAEVVQASMEKVGQLEAAQKTIVESVDDVVAKKLKQDKDQKQAIEDERAKLQKTLNQLSAFSNAVPEQSPQEGSLVQPTAKSLNNQDVPNAETLLAAKLFNSIKGATK